VNLSEGGKQEGFKGLLEEKSESANDCSFGNKGGANVGRAMRESEERGAKMLWT
jgi:hypothetical protein